jgi:hypothetical protein
MFQANKSRNRWKISNLWMDHSDLLGKPEIDLLQFLWGSSDPLYN